MIGRLYRRLHALLSRPEERGEYSAGRWQHAVRTAALDACRGETGLLLDAGCGEGLFLARLADTGSLDAVGVDIRRDLLRRAATRSQAALVQGDLTALPFADGVFDVIVCINVLFNLPRGDTVRGCLAELSRVAKPGGLLVIDFRNAANPLLRLKYAAAGWYDPTVRNLPLVTYHRSEVEGLLEENGWRVVRGVPVGFPRNRFSPIVVLEVRR